MRPASGGTRSARFRASPGCPARLSRFAARARDLDGTDARKGSRYKLFNDSVLKKYKVVDYLSSLVQAHNMVNK